MQLFKRLTPNLVGCGTFKKLHHILDGRTSWKIHQRVNALHVLRFWLFSQLFGPSGASFGAGLSSGRFRGATKVSHVLPLSGLYTAVLPGIGGMRMST